MDLDVNAIRGMVGNSGQLNYQPLHSISLPVLTWNLAKRWSGLAGAAW